VSLEHGFITGFSGKYVHHALRKYLWQKSAGKKALETSGAPAKS
jgi:hypothetical protein